MARQISVNKLNQHLSEHGYQGDLDIGGGGQQDVAMFNVRKDTAFHQNGEVLCYCKAFRERGVYKIRDTDAVQLATTLTIVPPRTALYD